MKAVVTEAEVGFLPKTLSITCESQEEYDYLTNLMSLTYDEVFKTLAERVDLGGTLETHMPDKSVIHEGEPLTAIRNKKGF